MTDLTTTYLGLALRSPLVASPSPLTGNLNDLVLLDEAGIGAVVLPSLFEEDVESEAMTFHDRFEDSSGLHPEALDYFPDVVLSHLGIDRHLRLLQEAVSILSIPVIASVNGRSAGGWVDYATRLADAGAGAIELNMYDVAAAPHRSASDVEQGYLTLVEAVRAAVGVPLSVKLSPYFSSFANFAGRVVDAGADGLVLFNRFYQPDLDLRTLDVTPTLDLSHTGEVRLPLRWIALLRPQLPQTSLALTSGVHLGTEIAKGLLAGADAVMSTAELLRRGPSRAGELIAELDSWMDAEGYVSVEQLKGSVAQHTARDPGAFERAQYQQVLAAWTR